MIPAAALALILTAHQIAALNQACMEGNYYGICKYEMAILLVESSACVRLVGDDGQSIGCGQLQIQTARQTCGCKVSAKRLQRDRAYNIRISAQFLSRCFNQFWPDRARAIYCYSAGIPKASHASAYQVKNSKYVARVNAWLLKLKQISVNHD